MTFGESIGTCLGKYATFFGTATRSEFWWFMVFVNLMRMGGGLVDGSQDYPVPFVTWLIGWAFLLPVLAVMVRRIHDMGRSGWWVLLPVGVRASVYVVGFLLVQMKPPTSWLETTVLLVFLLLVDAFLLAIFFIWPAPKAKTNMALNRGVWRRCGGVIEGGEAVGSVAPTTEPGKAAKATGKSKAIRAYRKRWVVPALIAAVWAVWTLFVLVFSQNGAWFLFPPLLVIAGGFLVRFLGGLVAASPVMLRMLTAGSVFWALVVLGYVLMFRPFRYPNDDEFLLVVNAILFPPLVAIAGGFLYLWVIEQQRGNSSLNRKGESVAESNPEEVRWARMAKEHRKLAKKGHADGQASLGVMYQNGRGVPQDDAEAVKWYRKAAEQGHAQAQYLLSNRYALGKGVTQDDAEAVRWTRTAATQGLAESQDNLGYMYQHGFGVTIAKDLTEARKWYEKAAAQGFASAQYNLGSMCQFGQGITKDLAEARKWYEKASTQGNSDAKKKLENL